MMRMTHITVRMTHVMHVMHAMHVIHDMFVTHVMLAMYVMHTMYMMRVIHLTRIGKGHIGRTQRMRCHDARDTHDAQNARDARDHVSLVRWLSALRFGMSCEIAGTHQKANLPPKGILFTAMTQGEIVAVTFQPQLTAVMMAKGPTARLRVVR